MSVPLNVQQDGGALPDLHSLETERLKVFWILAEEARHNPNGLLSSYAIAQKLELIHRVHIPRHRVDAVLRKEKNTVLKRLRGKTEYWKLMRAGEVELVSPNDIATFIDPSSAFTARRRVHEILSGLRGQLRFCDPYIDSTILDCFASCTEATSIFVLTSKIQSVGFVADLAAFNRQFGGKMQVRSVGKQTLHDRYVIHKSGMILLGASLKDVGRTPSFVVALGQDLTNAVSTHFNQVWHSATLIE